MGVGINDRSPGFYLIIGAFGGHGAGSKQAADHGGDTGFSGAGIPASMDINYTLPFVLK